MLKLFGHIKYLTLILFLLLLSFSVNAIDEDTAKAIYIHNIIKFTDWPDNTFTKHTIELCHLKGRNIGVSLAKLQHNRIKNNHLKFTEVIRLPQLTHCHIIFISGNNRKQLAKVFAIVDKRPILIIGEMLDFAELGGMINLLKTKQGTIRFEANPNAIKQAKLNVSSRILRLATIINEK